MNNLSLEPSNRQRPLFVLGFISFTVAASILLGLTLFSGPVRAIPADKQETEGTSAEKGAPEAKGAPAGMESPSDLAKEQPVSKEFLRALEARRKNVELREKALKEQEQELLMLRQDIEAKLARLEKTRGELEEMTRQLDKSQKKDLAKAVELYSAMDAQQAAKVFSQMDLESVVSILKGMEVETAGGILDAMAKEPGTDSAKMDKLKAIGESIFDSTKLKKP